MLPPLILNLNRLILHEPRSFLVIHFLLWSLDSILAHQLCIQEVVHRSDLLKELLVVREVDGGKNAFERSLPLILLLRLFQNYPLVLRELRDLFRLDGPLARLLPSGPPCRGAMGYRLTTVRSI